MGQGNNHPYGCPCNWCNNYPGKGGGRGGGNRSRRKVSTASPLTATTLPREPQIIERRTTPTRCPRCGAEVFFHRDENGGCAWLDPPLGAPWITHGCFERARRGAFHLRLSWEASGRSGSGGHALQIDPDEVFVQEQVQRQSGELLVILWHPATKALLPMLCEPPGFSQLGRGRLRLAERPGKFEINTDPPLELFGPVFDCRSLQTWRQLSGTPEDELLLARDLGLNRSRHFPVHSRFTAASWPEALKHYLPAIYGGDTDALREMISLIRRPARGLLPRPDEMAILRLYQQWSAALDAQHRDALFDEMLDLLKF